MIPFNNEGEDTNLYICMYIKLCTYINTCKCAFAYTSETRRINHICLIVTLGEARDQSGENKNRS